MRDTSDDTDDPAVVAFHHDDQCRDSQQEIRLVTLLVQNSCNGNEDDEVSSVIRIGRTTPN